MPPKKMRSVNQPRSETTYKGSKATQRPSYAPISRMTRFYGCALCAFAELVAEQGFLLGHSSRPPPVLCLL